MLASKGDGGLEKHTLELCESLSKQHGVEVHLIAPKNVLSHVPDTNIKTHAFEFKHSRYNLFQLIQIVRIIREVDPDLIHYQANKAAQIGSILKRVLQTPALCTIHNIKRRLGFLRSFQRVIAVSQNVANSFPSSTSYDVIYNGITINSDALKTQPLLSNPVKWIAIGRLVEAKGFDILLDAFKSVPGRLTIVGDGPQKRSLKQICYNNKISDRVDFLGTRQDVQTLLKEHDICVISSRNEGFSYVIAESLTHNTPVISTDVPVANEFFSKEKICLTDNPESLAHLMNNAITVGFDYSSEFKFAQDNFTLASMTLKTFNLYRDMLEQE